MLGGLEAPRLDKTTDQDIPPTPALRAKPIHLMGRNQDPWSWELSNNATKARSSVIIAAKWATTEGNTEALGNNNNNRVGF